MRMFILAAFAVVGAPAAMAQTDLMGRVVACAGLEDAEKRHACFDVLTPELRGTNVKALAEKSFGVTEQAAKQTTPDKLTLQVSSVSRASDGLVTFTMENGQVWTQTENRQLGSYNKGPWTAEIRKAMGGSFLMQINGGGSIRVKRIK